MPQAAERCGPRRPNNQSGGLDIIPKHKKSEAGARLRALIASGEILVAPGAYDGLSARLIEQAGFKAVYASGGAIARSMGIPDLGLLSFDEVAARLAQMVDAIDLPVIADADTGYGNALNARRAIRAFERAGVAGIHLEDQVFPKRCGHYEDKSLISVEEMVQKLRAVREAADPDFFVIARTDAIAVEGFESALQRAEAYAAAGADAIFVEAPTSEAQIEEVARRLKHPLLINMFKGGKTPLMPLERLQALGYRIVIIPSDLQRAAITSMREVLAEITAHGDSGELSDRMVTFKEREVIVGTADYLALEARYKS